MTTFEKLLAKIAATKAAARSGMSPDAAALSLLRAFELINRWTDTSRSDDPAELK